MSWCAWSNPIQTGWTSPPLVLERFGFALRADPVQKLGTALGQVTNTFSAAKPHWC